MQAIINGISWFFAQPYGATILLIVGFFLLIKGADFFVEGSSSVAKKLKIPSVIIGLTIVAMGTSLPETSVSTNASIEGLNSLAIGNVIGSNIFNLMVVVGVCAIMAQITVDKDMVCRDIPISLGAAGVLVAMSLIGFGVIGLIEGIILLVLFVAFIVAMVLIAMKARKNALDNQTLENEDDEIKERPLWLSLILIVGGGAMIIFGGTWVVDSSTVIAMALGMEETLVGLTIAAVGTSLPELVTSIVAARKNEVGLALGNAIGSNIYNILMILGIASTISPLTLIPDNIIDMAVLIAFTLLIWAVVAKTKKVSRGMGVTMIVLYCVYLAYIIARNYIPAMQLTF